MAVSIVVENYTITEKRETLQKASILSRVFHHVYLLVSLATSSYTLWTPISRRVQPYISMELKI